MQNFSLSQILQALGLNPLDPQTEQTIQSFMSQSSALPLSQIAPPSMALASTSALAPAKDSLLKRFSRGVERFGIGFNDPTFFARQRQEQARLAQEQQNRQQEFILRQKEFSSLEKEREAQTASARALEQERIQKTKQEKEDFDRRSALRNDVASGNPQSALGKSLVNSLGLDYAVIAVSDPDLFKIVNNIDVQLSKIKALQDKLQAQIDKLPTTLESAGIQEFVKTHGRLPNAEERKNLAKERPEKPTALDTFQLQRIDLKPDNPYGVTSMNAFIDPKRPGLIKDLSGNRIDPQFITGVGVMKETPQQKTKEKLKLQAKQNILDSQERLAIMQNAERNPNAQNDIALIFNHIGMTLGAQKGARITNTEIQRAISARSIPQDFLVLWERAKSGQQLSPQQRRQMVSLAEERLKAQRKRLQEIESDKDLTNEDSSDQKLPHKRYNPSTGKIEDIK